MVGFRVFDVGLLIVWLIWFFRLREDDDDSRGDDGGGGEGPDPTPGKDGPGGDWLRLPLGRVRPADRRARDGHTPPSAPQRRRGSERPVPGPVPARVRRPVSPTPVHRRTG